MLQVTFFRDARKRVTAIVARGHADAGPHGKDLVCAAASAILQAARLGLEEHVRVPLDATALPGELRMRWPSSARGDAALRAIVATTELSIAHLAKQYPRHVRVRRRSDKTG
ncbi:MAG: ribosomal-processing cysteine protease Prp [Candidatus Tyrphobacter sp.]